MSIWFFKRLIIGNRPEKIECNRTYSYKNVIRFSLFSVVIVSGLSLYIHYETGSTEASLTLFIFFLACILSGTIKCLLREKQIKRRGGTKEE